MFKGKIDLNQASAPKGVVSLGSQFSITRRSLVMQNSDLGDRFINQFITLMLDSYNGVTEGEAGPVKLV